MRSASAGSGSSSAEVTKYIAINVNHNYSRELVRTELGLLLDKVGGPKVHNKGGQSRPTLRLMLAQWKQPGQIEVLAEPRPDQVENICMMTWRP